MKHGRTDANQSEIVAALRACGCSVAITSDVGNGFPDLVVGYRDYNFLLEIKDGNKSPSARKLRASQKEFHLFWRGQVDLVKNVNEALVAVGIDYQE